MYSRQSPHMKTEAQGEKDDDDDDGSATVAAGRVAQGALQEELTPSSENPEIIPSVATKEPKMSKKS